MIVVAQFIWVAFLLASSVVLFWLVERAKGDRDRLEELIDRQDRITAAQPQRPTPTRGPATVPTGDAIDAWHKTTGSGHGRHARRGL